MFRSKMAAIIMCLKFSSYKEAPVIFRHLMMAFLGRNIVVKDDVGTSHKTPGVMSRTGYLATKQ
jgi:hypothetical protein